MLSLGARERNLKMEFHPLYEYDWGDSPPFPPST